MHLIMCYLRPLCFALVSLVVKIYSLLGQPLFNQNRILHCFIFYICIQNYEADCNHIIHLHPCTYGDPLFACSCRSFRV
jgi:hypothetical protein